MHRRDFPGRVSHGGTRRQTRRAPLRGTLTGTEPQRHPRLRGEAFVRRGSDQFDIWSAEYPLLVNPRSAMKSGIRARRRIAGLIESSEAAAILTFPASMRKAGCALFPFLQSEASGSLASLAQTRTFAVWTSPVLLRHSVTTSMKSRI